MAPAPPADPSWHPIAKRWYEALGSSGQRCFFEPSDWAQAELVAEGMSRMLQAERMSAQMFAAIDSASQRLLVTEGDRRRMRIELERRQVVDEDEDAAVASMDEWRSRLGG
jgi:ribosome-associated translation inhibitor RaiA